MMLLFLLIAQTGSPYMLSPVADTASIAVTGALWLLPELFKSEVVRPTPCPCDADGVNGLDRVVTTLRNPGVATASDILLLSMVTLPFAANALDVGLGGSPFAGWGTDTVVMLEALAAAGALNQLTKISMQRARPLLYNNPTKSELDNPDNMLSFFSGHSTIAFTMASAYSYTFIRRHPTSPWRFVVPSITGVIAALTSSFRVVAGKHFISDVLAGALVGTAIGLLVPFAHDQGLSVGASLPSSQAMMLTFGGGF